MNRLSKIIVFFQFFILVACDARKNAKDIRLKLTTSPNGNVLFESDPLTQVIIDPHGGLVFPLTMNDHKNVSAATIGKKFSKQYVTFSIGEMSLYTMNIHPDIEPELFYIRGNFKEAIKLMKKGGIKIISVDEVPTTNDDVEKVLQYHD